MHSLRFKRQECIELVQKHPYAVRNGVSYKRGTGLFLTYPGFISGI